MIFKHSAEVVYLMSRKFDDPNVFIVDCHSFFFKIEVKMYISTIKAREILDSRGNPTLEVTAKTKQHAATVAVPSGASVGTYEAVEKRDGEKRYHGKGVWLAIEAVNDILGPVFEGELCTNQKKIDHDLIVLDGTPNKSKYGANALLGISMAVFKLAALEKGIPLFQYVSSTVQSYPVMPHPFLNVINGGQHAGNGLDIQEFMIIPLKCKTMKHAMQCGVETFHTLGRQLKEQFGKKATLIGDEGGFAPPITAPETALDLLQHAIQEADYEKEIRIALDCAANDYYKDGHYIINGKRYTADALLDYYCSLIDAYPIMSIEDPFHEEDFQSHAALLKKLPEHKLVVGDDLLVTNMKRIAEAADQQAVNTLLLKPNQIGTMTEALDAFMLAKKHGWKTIVSHRSGETNDPFIADLAVGLGCGMIKAGAPCRGERVAKYNRLLEIEEEHFP